MVSDYLAHQDALPSTIVPGHHLVTCASDRIHVRRYKALSPVSSDQDADVPRELKDDPLESAWKAINESSPTDSEDVLRDGCALVVLEEGDRVLWVFKLDDQAVPGLPAQFQELEALDNLRPATLISCSVHGQSLACLKPATSAHKSCALEWTGDAELARRWGLLRDALVEKLAWREGSRVFTQANPLLDISAQLYPLPGDKLLLVVRAVLSTRCAGSGGDAAAHEPLLLEPLSLPALWVAPFVPSAAQKAHLHELFDSALGSSWNDGASGRQLALGLGTREHAEWGVYWVPVAADLAGITGNTASALSEKWKEGQGVLAVWPSHLVQAFSASPSSAAPAAPVLRHSTGPLAPLSTLPTQSDLMGTASSLFDFFSSYQPEPPQSEITPEPDGSMDEDVTVAAASPPASYQKTPAEDARSDIDDLFSEHSPTPPPGPVPLSRVPSPLPEGLFEDTAKADAFGLDQDDPMESPYDAVDAGKPAQRRPVQVEEPPVNPITEDDFDFFDSPTDGTDGPLAEDTPMMGDAPDLQAGQSPKIEEQDLDSAVNQISPDVQGLSTEGPDPHSPTKQLTTTKMPSVTSDTESQEGAPPTSKSPVPTTSTLPPRKTVTFVLSPPASPSLDMAPELIPLPFAPLDIDETSLPSSAYTLPSPAPTPDDLNPDLIDRLKSPKKEYDYVSTWDLESDVSEMDEDEDYSGAPPTPISMTDDSAEASLTASPKKADGGVDTRAIIWGDIACVTTDWIVLRGDERRLQVLSRSWSAGWAAGKVAAPVTAPPTPPPEEDKVERADIDHQRYLLEVISNRHFRATVLDELSSTATKTESALAQSGASLQALSADSADDLATPASKQLESCAVHTGFAGNIMQTNIASLRYWRQLGLQPAGGAKDITAYVVCGVEDGLIRQAIRFLGRLVQMYQACQLGTMSLGTGGAATDGVIAVPPSGFINSISGLLKSSSDIAVVFVVPPPTAHLTSSLLQDLFSATIDVQDNDQVSILPAHALQPRHAQSIAFDVYDRIRRPVRPTSLRGEPMETPDIMIQYPSFTLASSEPKIPELTLAWPLKTYDLMHKWRFVHAAYALDDGKENLVAMLVDGEGESWVMRHWRLDKEGGVQAVIMRLWEWFGQEASKLSVEYRLVIASLGMMAKDEMQAWKSVLTPRSPVTLVMADLSPSGASVVRPRAPFATVPPSLFIDPSSRIVDESLQAHLVTPPRTPLRIPATRFASAADARTQAIFPAFSFMLNVATPLSEYATSSYHVLYHRPPALKDDADIKDRLAGEYHRLACLGRMRFGLDQGPVHLAGVTAGIGALERIGKTGS